MCEKCDGKSSEQVRREFLRRIAEHDFTMVSVRAERARDGSWLSPGFVYSVGLWGFHRAPELIVVGAPRKHGVELVEKYSRFVKGGRRFEPGGPYPDFLPGVGVLLELVAPALYREWFASAFDFYPQGEFPAYQLLWPDRDGAWPWESRWQRHIVAQPVLTATGRPQSAGG
jgi:hypothetical protein